ncbi:MAG: ABC transporter ATP-binding protein [Clostridia bacterium]|nr:ABC transporter ATP-binding protein [Clostridia bacterium]
MRFNMAKEKVDSIKEYLIKFFKRQLLFEEFMALSDINITVQKGEVFGLIGLNGCGKSTLLKIISGIYKPSTGTVKVNGTIAPLIELGAGFDMDLTARENIYLNGSVLGYSKQYIEEKFDEIVDFTELHQFIDVPMKNFSSGMVARVGFAIATITKPDILIVDEILAVGDFLFQEKCEKRINELMSGGTTVIIVSHSIDQIKRLCDRVAWIEKGKIKMIGAAEEVCDLYTSAK